ncbi:Endoglucanase [Rhizophlyctis rosea]|nr:Endoglucanase [Rhizophlyctis rosea]
MLNLRGSTAALLLLCLSITSTRAQLVEPNGPIVDSSTYTIPSTPKYSYSTALHMSYLFYWSQRSGKQPYDRLAWRTDSCLDCKGTYGEDLSGGWYEAANTMKWGGPYGYTATQLAWNVYEYAQTFDAIGEYEESVMWVKHGAEYLLNVYTTGGDGSERLVGLFGISAAQIDGKAHDIDFGYFGPPEEYTQWAPYNLTRQAFYCTNNNGCSDIAGDYAAALASASIVLRGHNNTFADQCLDMATKIYNFAEKYQGSYKDTTKFPDYGWTTYREWYPSTAYTDELALSSFWMYLAHKNANSSETQTYLNNAKSHVTTLAAVEYSWDDKAIAVMILLYRETKDPALKPLIETFFNKWINPTQTGAVPRSPRGLAYYYKWGSLSYAANTAWLALIYAKIIDDQSYQLKLRTFAVQQTNYILGDCGRSWIPGFGDNDPKLPYHKSSYNSYIDYPMRGQGNDVIGSDFLNSRTPNRFILYGALVGGPEKNDTYVDNRENYVYTEVTQDYNAAWTGLLAGLIEFYGVDKFQAASDCGLNLGWDHKNAVASKKPVYGQGDCYHSCGQCPSDKNSRYQPPDNSALHFDGKGQNSNPADGKTGASGSSNPSRSTSSSGKSTAAGLTVILGTLALWVLA